MFSVLKCPDNEVVSMFFLYFLIWTRVSIKACYIHVYNYATYFGVLVNSGNKALGSNTTLITSISSLNDNISFRYNLNTDFDIQNRKKLLSGITESKKPQFCKHANMQVIISTAICNWKN